MARTRVNQSWRKQQNYMNTLTCKWSYWLWDVYRMETTVSFEQITYTGLMYYLLPVVFLIALLYFPSQNRYRTCERLEHALPVANYMCWFLLILLTLYSSDVFNPSLFPFQLPYNLFVQYRGVRGKNASMGTDHTDILSQPFCKILFQPLNDFAEPHQVHHTKSWGDSKNQKNTENVHVNDLQLFIHISKKEIF